MTEWKALLRRVKLEHIRRTAPGFFELSGGYNYKPKPYSDTSANGLTTCIEDFINHLEHGEASRTNSTGMPRIVGGQVRWTKGNTRKGVADIRGTYRGRSLSIEIKIGADRQSAAQRQEQERITRACGIYWVCRSFPHFLEQWKAAGFTIPQFEEQQKLI